MQYCKIVISFETETIINMEKKVSVTVIIPIYNQKRWLKKCVNSIITQTLKNIQIVLVDDGSTDGCAEICDELKMMDDRVTVVHQKNFGACAARNVGIDIASGEYILFLDSDNWCKTDFLEKLYDAAKKYNADIVTSRYSLVYPFLKPRIEKTSLPFDTVIDKKEIAESILYKYISYPKEQILIGTGNKIVKTAILRENDLRYLEDLSPAGSGADVLFDFETLILAQSLVVIENIGAVYNRMNEYAESSNYLKNGFEIEKKIRYGYKDLVKEHNLNLNLYEESIIQDYIWAASSYILPEEKNGKNAAMNLAKTIFIDEEYVKCLNALKKPVKWQKDLKMAIESENYEAGYKIIKKAFKGNRRGANIRRIIKNFLCKIYCLKRIK